MDILILAVYSALVWFVFIKMKWLPWVPRGHRRDHPDRRPGNDDPVPERLRAVDQRRARDQVRGQRGAAGPGARHRGAGRSQSPRQEGRSAVPDRSDRLAARRALARSPARRLEGFVARARRAVAQRAGQGDQARSAIAQADAKGREVQVKLDLAQSVSARTASSFPRARAIASRSNRPRATSGTSRRSSTPRVARWRSLAPVRCRRGLASGNCASASRAGSATSTRRSHRSARSSRTPSGSCRRRRSRTGQRLRDQRARRPGSFTAAFPITPAMTFVEEVQQVIALYAQNELHQVRRQRGRVHARHRAPRPHHQGDRRLDRLGAGAGPGAQTAHSCR